MRLMGFVCYLKVNTKIMKVAIFILFCFCFFSCSQSWYCKRCTQGTNRIEDVVTVFDTLFLPAAEADSTFKKLDYTINWDSLRNANPDEFPESPPCPELPPVMEIKKGKLSAIIKQTDQGLDVKIKDEGDTAVKKIEIPCITDVHTGYTLFQMILTNSITGLCVAGLVSLLFLFRKR